MRTFGHYSDQVLLHQAVTNHRNHLLVNPVVNNHLWNDLVVAPQTSKSCGMNRSTARSFSSHPIILPQSIANKKQQHQSCIKLQARQMGNMFRCDSKDVHCDIVHEQAKTSFKKMYL